MLQLDSDRRDRRCGCHSERRWRKSGAILALAVGCLMGVAAGSRAADATHAPVIVGARRLFDVGAMPGETAADRAAAVNRRIDSFVRNPQRIAPVEVRLRGQERVLAIGNRDLYTATITNNTASPYRRQEFLVGVNYEADLNRALELATRAAQKTPGVLADPAPDVLIDDLTSSGINLKVRFHADSRRGTAMPVVSTVRQRVKEAFQHAGIEIYPSGTQIVQLAGPVPAVPGQIAGQGPAVSGPAENGERSSPPPARDSPPDSISPIQTGA